ncbi:hypothetical protein TanjilG_14911 [Lupinus angustifolius]|uniref:MLO-like protein n=1 Tax=Lupinus angustifolius TaxID=3871 RepID=A0A1J7H745_LUPAN|nr:hypothetical protein TanjilG_14911 [Lupinus angustifolius]
MGDVHEAGRSLAETPTYSVASVITVMVFLSFLVERSIYRFGKWLKKTRRKALFASLAKIKEELMLLGLISLFLAQSARWISEICVDSSLFTSQFYTCSQQEISATNHKIMLQTSPPFPPSESTTVAKEVNNVAFHQCREGHEPFVSYEGLEQLHRFLFVLGITHVLYSCLAVGLAMSKIYSWRKWENQATMAADGNLQGLNIYFWLSFIPALNAFEMASFLWTLWGFKEQSCFMRNHYMIIIRLTSGVLVQFWCSYMTVPLNVIVSQMGSRCKKALVAESVRESLHSWCKRVKQKSKHDSLHTARSVCSIESTIDEITVVSESLQISMDKYELVKDIGSGNFGVARLMRNKLTKDLVAMKFIERGHKQICHRDLKLENTLLDGSPAPRLKICDFGYSKSSLLHSRPKSTVGTPAYIAPEVFSRREYDGKMADVWSCGVTLYVMLVGAYPFEDQEDPKNFRKTINRIMAVQYKIPDYVHISQDCRRLLSRIFVANPVRRVTIKELKSHPWFLKNLPRELTEMAQAVYYRKEDPTFSLQSIEDIMNIVEEAKTPALVSWSIGGFGWGDEEEEDEEEETKEAAEAGEEDEYELRVKEAQASGEFHIS